GSCTCRTARRARRWSVRRQFRRPRRRACQGSRSSMSTSSSRRQRKVAPPSQSRSRKSRPSTAEKARLEKRAFEHRWNLVLAMEAACRGTFREAYSLDPIGDLEHLEAWVRAGWKLEESLSAVSSALSTLVSTLRSLCEIEATQASESPSEEAGASQPAHK